MDVQNILHMSTGNGESSYAKNSFLQETVIRKTLPVLKRSIKGMASRDVALNKCFLMADLGCSNGTNTLLVASMVIDIVLELSKEDGHDHKTPQILVYLNDLFGNDFNTIFQSLPSFYESLKKEKGEKLSSCFVSATPGSFHDRLFLDGSLHLVYSSYALHWLSQVPEGVENNKETIYMAKTSPLNVFKAYGNQFQIDFNKFLQMRAEEVVSGGCMVLSFLGRSVADPTSDDCSIWEPLAQSLQNMAKEEKKAGKDRPIIDGMLNPRIELWEINQSRRQGKIELQGMVEETYINTFNVPTYFPCEEEISNVIHSDGSFSLDTLEVFRLNWDPYDTDYTSIRDLNEHNHIHGENTAKTIRAVSEPLLTSHFGNLLNLDVLFKKVEKQAAKHLANKKTRHFNIVVSLTRK